MKSAALILTVAAIAAYAGALIGWRTGLIANEIGRRI